MAGLYWSNGALISFGDGSLGNLTISNGSTTSITSSTAYYANIIVENGGILKIARTSDFRCSGTLTVNSGGTIIYDSASGGGNAGSTATSGSGTGGGGGGGYAAGSNGGNGARNGSSGTATGGSAYIGSSNAGLVNYTDIIATTYNGGNGAWGQGGDGGTPDNAGGGSGGGGGSSFKIIANTLINNGTISVAGQNGQPGGTNYGSGQGGGGGGGGGGGTLVVIAANESGTGIYKTSGGSGSGGGGGGVNASNSNYGGTGGAGGYGRVIRYVGVSSGSLSVTPSGSPGSTPTYLTYDTTPPSIGTPVLSFPNGAGANQNQIVTVSITDSQTSVSNPTAVFQTVTGTNNGTVTLTSFNSGTAIFTISNQTGDGSARLRITAVDAAGNSATAYSPAWTIDNSPPSGYIPFFGNGTTDWIIDGTTTNAGISTWQDENAGVHYYVTDCWNETGTHTVNLRNLEIANNFKLEWKGVLILNVKNTATINGTLGWGMHNVNVQVYGRVINGGGRSGTGGRYDDNTGNPGWNGWGYSASGAYGAYGGSGGGGGSQGNDPGGGNGGQHLYRVPISADTRTTVISRGVAIGNGGGGGGAANGTGGTGGYGGGGLILFAQTLSGSGIIDVSGTRGRDPQTLNTEYNGAGGGGGAGGHVVAIVGTSNFANGKIYASGGGGGVGAYWSSDDGRYNHTSPSGGSGSNGYINFYYNTGSLPSTVFPAIINTVKTDTTIPATIADNQPSVTSALLTSSYRKNGQVQRISISYSKTMTDSEVKITLSGAANLAATVMTKAASPANTYYYDYTHGTGNGTISYSIEAKDNVYNPAATVSGSWILDNTAPSFTSSISPNKTFFLGGESISYTITGTETSSMASVPSISLVKGSDFYGTSPPTVNLTTSSVSGSTFTYSSYTTLPIGIGTLSATVSGTDVAANTGTDSGLSTIKLLPPSGMIWS